MRTLKNVFAFLSSVIMGSLLITCNKEDDKTVATDNEVTFSINISNLESASVLKSAMDYDLASADKIVLTIQHSDGSPTKFTSYKVDIQQITGMYHTQKIMLTTGNYNLTEFLVLNAAGNTIFAVPLNGSKEAQNISNPLPVAFSVINDITTTVPIEVVSTINKIPEDFGLIRFPILEVKTFNFGIGVIDHETGKVLSAKLVTFSGDYINKKKLDSVLTNVVTVKDGFSKYTLIIEKSGYESYAHTYSLDSLKMFKDSVGNTPMLVELGKDDETTVMDCDGNVYHSVTIGTQVWMVENLKTNRFNDYTPIPLQVNTFVWYNKNSGYTWYYHNELYKNPYGALYKWYTVNTGKLCPIGWHVSSVVDWDILVNYLGGADVAGNKLKEAGNAHWFDNVGATNETGFTALAGGMGSGTYFDYMRLIGYWWTSIKADQEGYAHYYSMSSNSFKVYKDYVNPPIYGNMNNGFSVRCVKD
jgi:uncharacterized protein (TIGR02145 family)